MQRDGQEREWIVVRGMGSVSGLGCTPEEVRRAYVLSQPTFTYFAGATEVTAISPISSSAQQLLAGLVEENPVYRSLDRSVHLAMLAARQAVAQSGWEANELEEVGVNIGSSRGATGLFEQYHASFITDPSHRLSPGTSPTTTLGNVASWVAHDVQASGPQISHSVTCSTAAQAFANALAWLRSGMAKRFLVGGTEAPLTPFTVSQMKAIGIYSRFSPDHSPCRPLSSEGLSTFVLGEGAAVFALERLTATELEKMGMDSVVVVEAVGMGFERTPSKTGLSPEGLHFQKSMQQAIQQASLDADTIDALIMHAPGTRAGDSAEKQAVTATFGTSYPLLYSNKNLIGHTLGASGALSAEMAVHLLNQEPLPPILKGPHIPSTKNFQRVLVNSAGFGGNSASILLRKL